jgi:ABC-2 type transport system permease protein
MSNSLVYDSRKKNASGILIFKTVYQSRDLLKLLIVRDVTLRYKRSVLGVLWTLFNPLVTSLVLWAIFAKIFGGKLAPGVSYGQFVLSGILFSTFFSQGITLCADSIANSTGILSKVAVAPEVFAFSAGIAAAINFLMGLIALVGLTFVIGNGVALTAPLVIVMVICMVMLNIGAGLMLSLIYIRFDDARNIVNVLLMVLTYLTPIFYPETILGHQMKKLVSMNPLTSFIRIFRSVFSNNGSSSLLDWIYMVSISTIVFLFGTIMFNRYWKKMIVMM